MTIKSKLQINDNVVVNDPAFNCGEYHARIAKIEPNRVYVMSQADVTFETHERYLTLQ